jgi:hypothetical protein
MNALFGFLSSPLKKQPERPSSTMPATASQSRTYSPRERRLSKRASDRFSVSESEGRSPVSAQLLMRPATAIMDCLSNTCLPSRHLLEQLLTNFYNSARDAATFLLLQHLYTIQLAISLSPAQGAKLSLQCPLPPKHQSEYPWVLCSHRLSSIDPPRLNASHPPHEYNRHLEGSRQSSLARIPSLAVSMTPTILQPF